MEVGDSNAPGELCFRREWASSDAETFALEGSASLRVLSLNLLADGLCAGGAPCSDVTPSMPLMFAKDCRLGGVALLDEAVSPEFSFKFRSAAEPLEWKRRWPMLLKLILDQDPDLIGLQEVDLAPGDRQGNNPAHDEEIRQDLAKAGYEGVFAKKYGRACDGVALFWKSSRLCVAHSCKTLGLGSVFVALAQPLILDGEWWFTAVSTHLKAGLSADAESMRLKQIKSLMNQLWTHQNIVLMADLNAHCRPWINDEKVYVQPDAYSALAEQMWSAYRVVLGDEPDFTSWGGWDARDVRGVFDYIFFRGDIFSARSVLQTPIIEEVLQIQERMPNPNYPSDHVPVVADIRVFGEYQQASKRQRRWIAA